LVNWIEKEDPTICCLKEPPLTDINKHCLSVKEWKNIDSKNIVMELITRTHRDHKKLNSQKINDPMKNK
jgi:hypothetical protein